MAEILKRLALFILKAIVQVDDLVPECEMNILGTRCEQAFIRGHDIAVRLDDRVILGMRKPDAHVGNGLNLFILDRRIKHGLTNREGGRKEIRIGQNHAHRHESAVGIAPDIDAVRIDREVIVRNKFIDRRF